MKTIALVQGTPEWHAHRAQHWNASEAPAMLGLSSYKPRSQLVRETATGVTQELDEVTLQRFADGHRYEALARPLAEEIIGEELYPCVGVEGRFSASFDGLTLMEDQAFEHKSLNDALRAAMVEGCTGADLPEEYRVQMEQQLMVSGACRVLFMASKWKGDELVEERHTWYLPDLALRERIVAGWTQFEADVCAYLPEVQATPVAAGRAPDQLPALHIEVTGMVTASNLAEFKERAIAVFQGISTDLQTDTDFANAEQTVKWCGDIEDKLKAAKEHALGQTQSIDALFKAIDAISMEARAKRLELDKLVKQRKESIRGEIVERGRKAVVAHYGTVNSTMGEHSIPVPAGVAAELGQVIKGKKTVASLNEAIDSAVANFKIAANQRADQVRASIHAFEMEVGDYGTLFPDRVTLCASKAPEDLRNLIVMRIQQHKDAEQARQDKIDQAQRDADAAATTKAAEEPAPVAAAVAPAATTSAPVQEIRRTAAPTAVASTVKIKLGDLNARIAPLTISADGLTQLGFPPAAKERGATLYREADFPAICQAMTQVLGAAVQKLAA